MNKAQPTMSGARKGLAGFRNFGNHTSGMAFAISAEQEDPLKLDPCNPKLHNLQSDKGKSGCNYSHPSQYLIAQKNLPGSPSA